MKHRLNVFFTHAQRIKRENKKFSFSAYDFFTKGLKLTRITGTRRISGRVVPGKRAELDPGNG